LTSELSTCHDTISNLRFECAKLIAKVEKLNVCDDSFANLKNDNASLLTKIDKLNACKPSTSSADHVTICTRCRDINVDAIHDHLALIKQQNDHIAQLSAKINEHDLENENLNLLEVCSIMRDALGLRMALTSNRETMSSLMPLKDCLILLRARLPWLKITRAIFYILLVIPSTKLGEFMLGNLIMFHTMLFCIKIS
jgi:hypothetical protein